MIGTHVDVLCGDYLRKAVECGLQLGASCAEEVDKLFRLSFSARRPEAPASTASQDNAETVLFFFHISKITSKVNNLCAKVRIICDTNKDF